MEITKSRKHNEFVAASSASYGLQLLRSCLLLFLATIMFMTPTTFAQIDLGNMLASAPLAGLITQGTNLLQTFDPILFNGGITARVNTPITIVFNKAVIVTGVGGFYNPSSGVQVRAGPTSQTSIVCGDGMNSVEVTVPGFPFIVPFTICPEGIYATQVIIENGTDSQEVVITGYEIPPAVDETQVAVTYNFLQEGNIAWKPYMVISWPQTVHPTCPDVFYTQQFGLDGIVTFTDGTFPEDSGSVRIFGIDAMVINTEGIYNVTLVNEFRDSVLHDDTTLNTRIESLPITFSVTRGPFCWVGECSENETEHECDDRFEIQRDDVNQTDWLPVMGQIGVCFLTVSYGTNESLYEFPSESFRSVLDAVDADAGSNLTISGVPDGIFYDEQSFCYVACVGGLYQFANPGSDSPLNLTQRQCNWMTRNFCCENDFCFTPTIVHNNDTFMDSSMCRSIFYAANRSAWVNLGECLYPEPIDFVPDPIIGGEKGKLYFDIHDDVNYFDTVILELTDINLNVIRSDDRCDAPEGTNFTGGNTYFCEVHNLRPNTIYFVRLMGYTASDNNIADGGLNDGLTAFSLYFKITTEDSLTLNCETNQYTIQFYYDDVLSGNPTFRDNLVQSAPNGVDTTPFDSQDIVQTQYLGSDSHFIISEQEVELYRGFPSSVHVQYDSTRITHLFFQYSFQQMRVIYGNESTFDEQQTQNVSLINKCISNVEGEFNGNGELAAIRFTYVDLNMTSTKTDCFGPGNCDSGFNVTQSNGMEFVATMSGETATDTGYIVALSFKWTSINFATYSLTGDSSCVMEAIPDWNDIEKYAFTYTVSPPSSCGSVRTVDPDTKLINYTNSIGTGNSSAAIGTDIIDGVGVQAVRSSAGGFTLVCCYNSSGQVHNEFSVEGEDGQSVYGTNEIPYQLVFYSDSSYTRAFGLDTVVNVLMNERYYFAAEFKDNDAAILGGMTLYAPECYATPNASPEKTSYFTLESDGCPVAFDDSFQRDEVVRSADGDRRDPMSHVAFGWQNNIDGVVYIHCKIIGCTADNSGDCVATSTAGTCPATKRRRRAIGDGGLKGERVGGVKTGSKRILKQMTISSQPVYFINPSNTLEGKKGLLDSEGSWIGLRRSQLSLSFIGAMAFLLCKVVHSWYKRNKHINKQTQDNNSNANSESHLEKTS